MDERIEECQSGSLLSKKKETKHVGGQAQKLGVWLKICYQFGKAQRRQNTEYNWLNAEKCGGFLIVYLTKKNLFFQSNRDS